jgi:hypothetical protein
MQLIPHEFSIAGVYFPPLLIAAMLGVLAAWVTVLLLVRYRLSRYFYQPPLIFVALVVIYTGLIGTFVVPS